MTDEGKAALAAAAKVIDEHYRETIRRTLIDPPPRPRYQTATEAQLSIAEARRINP